MSPSPPSQKMGWDDPTVCPPDHASVKLQVTGWSGDPPVTPCEILIIVGPASLQTVWVRRDWVHRRLSRLLFWPILGGFVGGGAIVGMYWMIWSLL